MVNGISVWVFEGQIAFPCPSVVVKDLYCVKDIFTTILEVSSIYCDTWEAYAGLDILLIPYILIITYHSY